MTEARKNRSLRISEAGEKAIQEAAERDGLDWSEEARRMLAYAIWKMPAGWHPGVVK